MTKRQPPNLFETLMALIVAGTIIAYCWNLIKP